MMATNTSIVNASKMSNRYLFYDRYPIHMLAPLRRLVVSKLYLSCILFYFNCIHLNRLLVLPYSTSPVWFTQCLQELRYAVGREGLLPAYLLPAGIATTIMYFMFHLTSQSTIMRWVIHSWSVYIIFFVVMIRMMLQFLRQHSQLQPSLWTPQVNQWSFSLQTVHLGSLFLLIFRCPTSQDHCWKFQTWSTMLYFYGQWSLLDQLINSKF